MRVRVGQLPYKRELLALTKVSPVTVTIEEWIRGRGHALVAAAAAQARDEGRRHQVEAEGADAEVGRQDAPSSAARSSTTRVQRQKM